MFNCEICHKTTEPGELCHKHPIMRTIPGRAVKVLSSTIDTPERKEIAKEVKCCKACAEILQAGVPLPALIRQRRREQEEAAQKAIGPKKLDTFPTTKAEPKGDPEPLTEADAVALEIGTLRRPHAKGRRR